MVSGKEPYINIQVANVRLISFCLDLFAVANKFYLHVVKFLMVETKNKHLL